MNQLNSKIKTSKTKTKINQHKVEWIKTFTSLTKQFKETEDFLENFLIDRKKGKGKELFNETCEEDQEMKMERRAFEKEIMYPVNGIRSLFISYQEDMK
jgi:hypothetical protein